MPHRHGRARRHPLYAMWHGMRMRCKSPKAKSWPRYGGRGIRLCERWESFAAFVQDMGPRPPGAQIERIDNDGPYAPYNCRWATATEQARNKRNNVRLTSGGRTLTVAAWAAELGLSPFTIYTRIRSGATAEQALVAGSLPRGTLSVRPPVRRGQPVTFRGETKTLPEWIVALGLNRHTVYVRLRRGHPAAELLSARNLRYLDHDEERLP